MDEHCQAALQPDHHQTCYFPPRAIHRRWKLQFVSLLLFVGCIYLIISVQTDWQPPGGVFQLLPTGKQVNVALDMLPRLQRPRNPSWTHTGSRLLAIVSVNKSFLFPLPLLMMDIIGLQATAKDDWQVHISSSQVIERFKIDFRFFKTVPRTKMQSQFNHFPECVAIQVLFLLGTS